MRFEYTLCIADYRAALALYTRQKWSRRLGFWFAYRILPLCGLVALSAQFFFALAGRDSLKLDPSWPWIVPLMMLFLPLWRKILTGNQFKQMFPVPNRNLSLDIDEDRLICINPGNSESRFSWSAILSFAQDDKIAIIFVAKARFLFFPAQAMSPEQRVELQNLMDRNLPRN